MTPTAAAPLLDPAEVERLNALPKLPGAPRNRILEPGVVRPLDGRCWAFMAHRDRGWASAFRCYESLDRLLEHWDVAIVGQGADEHSAFVEVAPRRPPARAAAGPPVVDRLTSRLFEAHGLALHATGAGWRAEAQFQRGVAHGLRLALRLLKEGEEAR